MQRMLWRNAVVVLAIAVAALGLAGLRPPAVMAAINGVSSIPTDVAPGGYAIVTIDADEGGGDVRVSATQGRLFTRDSRLPVACDSPMAMPVPQETPAASGALVPPLPPGCRDVRGEGTLDMAIPDASNLLDTVRVLIVLPELPGLTTVVAVQGASAKTVVLRVVPETGTFTIGSVPSNGGFALVVFGGGTFEQLVAAARCPGNQAAFWVTNIRGDFVTFIPGATAVAAVNAPFAATFPERRIPPSTPLIARCLVPVPVSSGVEGVVTIGPTCPVQRVLPDPDCIDRPYAGAVIVLLTQEDGREVTRATSGADGRYRIVAPLGVYTLKPLSPPGQPFPVAPSQRVIVPESGFVRVDVQYDSGIR